jgi:glycosyltransferase involved in cell wall biosynthesis
MKIQYLAFIRLPTEKAHGAQIMKTCEALGASGNEVELVIPGRRTHVSEEPFTYYGAEKSFMLTALNTYDLISWGPLGFLASLVWFSEAAKLRKRFWDAEIIYSRDASVLLQYVLLGRKLVYEAHTRPTWISTFIAKSAHHVIVISEGLRDAYLSRGVREGRITVAHDAVDVDVFKKEYSQKESRDFLGVPQNKKLALYVGRIDAEKGADTFAAASEYVDESWLCVLIGPGPFTETLKKQYPKALFLPQTHYRDMPRVLAAADVLVLPNSGSSDNAALYTSPLKAFAYLASGKPIVASDVPSLRAILKESATYSPAGDAQGLAEAITSAKPQQRTVDVFSWHDRAHVIVNALS